jgi:hypothetical protein
VKLARGLLLAGAATFLGATALALLAAARHDDARAAWSRESVAVTAAGYSAERSDALYAAVLAHRADAARDGWAILAGAWVMAAGWTAFSHARGSRAPASAWAATASTWVDAAGLAAAIAGAMVARDLLGAAHAAHGALIELVVPGSALAACWATLGAGRTPGSALLRARFARPDGSPPGAARATLALVLLPVALVASPLTLLRGRVPVHLRWAGLEVHRVGRGRTPSR